MTPRWRSKHSKSGQPGDFFKSTNLIWTTPQRGTQRRAYSEDNRQAARRHHLLTIAPAATGTEGKTVTTHSSWQLFYLATLTPTQSHTLVFHSLHYTYNSQSAFIWTQICVLYNLNTFCNNDQVDFDNIPWSELHSKSKLLSKNTAPNIFACFSVPESAIIVNVPDTVYLASVFKDV